MSGVCLWFTGTSGSGKTTVTNALVPMLEDRGRTVSVLDVVPDLAKHWAEATSEPKLMRKAFVAGEVARHGGIAICVTVSAKADVRARARELIGPDRFLEIFFDAPVAVTARRRATRKKRTPLLKRVRRMVRRIRRIGRSGPEYQRPASPDLTLRSVDVTPDRAARAVIHLLVERGFLAPEPTDSEETGATATAGPASATT